MSWLGSVPSVQFHVDATDTNVPSDSSNPLQLTASEGLAGSVMSVEIINRLAGDAELLAGPNNQLERICLLPAGSSETVHSQRQPIALARGVRLSVRSLDTAISTGDLYINCWT